jgi:hypothetical protein
MLASVQVRAVYGLQQQSGKGLTSRKLRQYSTPISFFSDALESPLGD